MTLLAEMKKILGAEQRVTSDAVRVTITKTSDYLVEIETKRAKLAEQRVAALLGGTDVEVKKIDEQLASLRLDRERAEAALEVLAERRDILVEAERIERAMRERVQLDEKIAAVAARVAERYPILVAELRDLIREIAEADTAVAAFHHAHPDAPELVGVEARARFQGSMRRVVHEEVVWAWKAPNGALFTHEQAPDVRPEAADEPTRGMAVPRMRAVETKPKRWLDEIGAGRASASAVYRSGMGRGHRMVPVRARRVIVEIVPAHRPSALATTLRLPPLRPGDLGFGPLASAAPQLVMAALSTPPAAPDVEQRVELVEITTVKPAQ